MTPNRFLHKHAAITGGGSGIGRAIALRLASEGAEVIILENNPTAGQAVVDEIISFGGLARTLSCDVSNTASVRDAFSQIECLNVLVNNAGIAHIGDVEQTTPEDMDRLYAVNLKGVYHCLHFGVPKLMESKRGVILNIASVASKIGVRERFAYSMSKGAVLTMTLSVARDYVGKGIRCNCICPARIHTPFVDGYLEKHYPDNKDEMFSILSSYQPIGRMGLPDEVASLAAFLCSEEAAFITGSAYDLDGGVTLLR